MSAPQVANSIPDDLSHEALEAAPKAWYDDLNITTVFVAGFVSTVLTVVIIAVVQGLFFHWQNEAIQSRKSDSYISPAQAIIDAQRETLTEGALPQALTSRIDGPMYYPQADKRVLISLDEAKQKVMTELGGATN